MQLDEIAAVVVTYNYSYKQLTELIVILHDALNEVFLIDNNPQPQTLQIDALRRQFPRCNLILNHANLGVSKALNKGIEQALARNYAWLLLFDQDSRPTKQMMQRLLDAAVRCEASGARIAAIGPCILDERIGLPLPFLRFNWRGVLKDWPDPLRDRLIETDVLITSGCLLNLGAVRDIGAMDETLFIDNIDLEWCFRAKAAGYQLFGVATAVLNHRLGDSVHHFPRIKKRVLIHGPERQYHIMRNRLLLYRRRYIPTPWKLADAPRFVFKLFYFSLFVKPRWLNLLMMLRGVRDGLAVRANNNISPAPIDRIR